MPLSSLERKHSHNGQFAAVLLLFTILAASPILVAEYDIDLIIAVDSVPIDALAAAVGTIVVSTCLATTMLERSPSS